MRYQLVALPLAARPVLLPRSRPRRALQWLDLDAGAGAARWPTRWRNAPPENARYRYDYFTDNCSTRVRDALDRALGGALHQQMVGRSHGNTFRSEAVRLASPRLWMWLGFDIGLGPYADAPLSRWEEAFVPMRLADSLREMPRIPPAGRWCAEQVLLPHRIAPEPPERRAAGGYGC